LAPIQSYNVVLSAQSCQNLLREMRSLVTCYCHDRSLRPSVPAIEKLKPAAWNLKGTTEPLVPNTSTPTPPTAYQMVDDPRFLPRGPAFACQPTDCLNTPERTGTLRIRQDKPDSSRIQWCDRILSTWYVIHYQLELRTNCPLSIQSRVFQGQPRPTILLHTPEITTHNHPPFTRSFAND
jgi:hypothetical protein